jgi:hypothetical protein
MAARAVVFSMPSVGTMHSPKDRSFPPNGESVPGELFRVGFEAREIVNLDFSYNIGGFGGGISEVLGITRSFLQIRQLTGR